MIRDDDACTECGHERGEHRNGRCYATTVDDECQCDDDHYEDQ